MLKRFNNGNILVNFIRCDPPAVPEDETIPLTWAMVVIKKEGRYLLHHNFTRKQWECAGGGWEEGETIEECAIREALEETSQKITDLKSLGVFKLYLKKHDRYEYGALFMATFDEYLPFKVNDESDRIKLWHPNDTLDDRLSELSMWMIFESQDLTTKTD